MKNLSISHTPPTCRPTRILQFGNGNFLRGFVDWMIDIANEKEVFDGNIHIAQIHSKTGFEQMKTQNCLFHVIEEGKKNGEIYRSTRLVKSVSGISFPQDDYPEYLKLGENPDLRFVISNTTEAGIIAHPSDDRYDTLPETFPGKLTALLHHRFQFFEGDLEKGLILIPCELIEKNGQILKSCIFEYARFWGLSTVFTDWVSNACIFCDTLVDRIVPGFPKDRIQELENQLGYHDDLIVMAEPFHLWVIEGPEQVKNEFPLDQAGLNVKFVADLTPYRTQKVRILNGAHTALVPWAYLNGLRTLRESVENPPIGKFLRDVIFEEIIPTLDMPKDELEKYAEAVLERFANPFIVHELKSIALNSISKFRVRVLPSLLSYWEKHQRWPENLILAFAALLVFYKGELKGEILPVNDEKSIVDFFQSTWALPSYSETISQILANEHLWHQNLDKFPGLRQELTKAIESIMNPNT
jgi:tagaturonate reductase